MTRRIARMENEPLEIVSLQFESFVEYILSLCLYVCILSKYFICVSKQTPAMMMTIDINDALSSTSIMMLYVITVVYKFQLVSCSDS